MGVTAAIGSIASAGYSIYQATRKPKQPVAPVIPSVSYAQSDIVTADAASRGAIQKQKKTASAAKGRSSTILTSPQGLNTPAPGRTSLLGM